MLTGQESSNEDLRQDLANQKATIETVLKSLTDGYAKSNQPSVDHCAARLQDLEVRLNQKHAQELNEQEARMKEGFGKDANTFPANRDAELAKATAKAKEESRRSQKVIAGLEVD